MCLVGTALLLRAGLTTSQEIVIALQKSAEGIVGGCRPARVLRHSKAKAGETDKPNRSPTRRPERSLMFHQVNGAASKSENS